MPELHITPEEAQRLMEGLERMERIGKEVGQLMRQPQGGHVNNAAININAGGWFVVGATFFMAICCAITATLYFADRENHRDEVSGLHRDISDLKADQKDLRDNQTTLQAYINQLYKDKSK